MEGNRVEMEGNRGGFNGSRGRLENSHVSNSVVLAVNETNAVPGTCLSTWWKIG